jgi:hypothetical protein
MHHERLDVTEWTVEAELQKLAGVASMSTALKLFGLLKDGCQEFTCVYPPEGWYRSGAETYVYRFQIRTGGIETGLVLKACVAFSPGRSLENLLTSWIERRKLVCSRGVRVPVLYAWGQGELLEEYVPFAVQDILTGEAGPPNSVLIGLAELAGVVASLGFVPIRLFDDLRSHGDDVVMVDFGEDLGPPEMTKDNHSRVFEMLMAQLHDWGLSLSASQSHQLLAVFERQRSVFRANQ